jgi:hypothetical protein
MESGESEKIYPPEQHSRSCFIDRPLEVMGLI